MLNIYLMHCLRQLRNPATFEFFLFAIFSITLFIFVSVPSVVSNMLHSGNFYRYFLMAFSNTDTTVQLLLILTGFVFIFFVRNIALSAILKTRPV